MSMIFGTPYTPPTPEELQALVREAHRERGEAMRDTLRALFTWRREGKAEPATYAALRPSL